MSKQKSCRTCIYGPVPVPGERCQYRCAPHNWAEYVDDGSVTDVDEPVRLPDCSYYVDDHAGMGGGAAAAMQGNDEDRIDIIGQNGNGGEHYDETLGVPVDKQKQRVIRVIPTKVIAVDAADDILFSMEAFDEFTVNVDIKTVVGKGNIKEVTDAMAAALDVMCLES